MCFEDERIGAATSGSMEVHTVGAASTDVASPSNSRRSLIFGAPLAGTVTVSPTGEAVAGQGLVLVAGGSPVKLTLADQGDLVRKGWSAIADGAGRLLPVFESIYSGSIPKR